MSLPGIGVACYDLEVTTASDTVWTKGDPTLTLLGHAQAAPPDALSPASSPNDSDAVCSDQYGNRGGGGITYIGPCDSSADADTGAADGVQNTVTLWVDGLYNAGKTAEIGEWRDPCPNGCSLQIDCLENEDSLAEFNLTIMRDANQGFFDVAVNFEDIFCSAKLDTCYGDSTDSKHIELLFGADAERDWTAVFGFACSAGAGDANTTLAYSDVSIVCGTSPATTFPIDPTGPEGNNSVTVGAHTLHYGIYRGVEQLNCDDSSTETLESCNKLYWNLAFSLDDLAAVGGGCTLAFSATATDGNEGFVNGLPTALGVAYPYIDVDAPLTPAQCQRSALNGGGGVGTGYHGTVAGLLPPVKMCSQYDGATASNACVVECPCWDSAEVFAAAAAIMSGGPGTYEWDFEDDESEEIELELQGAVGSLLLGVEPTDACLADGDIPEVELDGLSMAEYVACLADIRVVVNDPCRVDNGGCTGATPGCEFDYPGQSHCVGCPCWDSADVFAASETIMSGGPGTYLFELEDESDASGSEIELSLESDLGGLFLGVESGGGEYFCFAEGDGIEGGAAEGEVTFGEYSACLSDIRTVVDDRCQVNNGGCTGATPVCSYDGPGLFHCRAAQCPCWDSAAVFQASQSIIAGGPGTYAWDFENESDPDDTEIELGLDGELEYLFVGVEGDGQTFGCFAEGSGIVGGEVSMQGISYADWLACIDDILAMADDRCQVSSGGCSGATPGCVYAGPGQVQCVECATDANCIGNGAGPDCNPETNMCGTANMCLTANGGCGGTTPTCVYDAPFQSHCVGCLSDYDCASGTTCDTYTSVWAFTLPTYQTCLQCGAHQGFVCPSGQWCDAGGSCQAPGTWSSVAPGTVNDYAAWEQTCLGVGRHVPTWLEVWSAMVAQFEGGIDVGVTFLADNGQRYLGSNGAGGPQSGLGWYTPATPAPNGSPSGIYFDGYAFFQALLCAPN